MSAEARWIRSGLGALLALDGVALGVRCLWRWDHALVDQSAWLGSPMIAACLSAVAFIAGLFVAKGSRLWVAGIAALIATGALVEIDGALFGDYSRNFFHPGAMLLAWLMADLVGRLGGVTRPELRQGVSAHAAVCVLGATYVNAGLSKLLASDGGWINPAVLRLTVMMERQPGAESPFDPLRDLLINSPELAAELAVLTVIVEVGAIILWFGPRLRAIGAASLLALHAGMAVMLEIVFWEPVFLLLWCGFPWWRMRGGESVERVVTASEHRRLRAIAACLMIVVIGVAAVPIRATQGGGVRSLDAVERESLSVWGPFREGEAITPDWRLESIRWHPHRVELGLVGEEQARVTFILGDPQSQVMPGPVAVWPLRLAYDKPTVPFERFRSAFEALGARMKESAGSDPLDEAFGRWHGGGTDE